MDKLLLTPAEVRKTLDSAEYLYWIASSDKEDCNQDSLDSYITDDAIQTFDFYEVRDWIYEVQPDNGIFGLTNPLNQDNYIDDKRDKVYIISVLDKDYLIVVCTPDSEVYAYRILYPHNLKGESL